MWVKTWGRDIINLDFYAKLEIYRPFCNVWCLKAESPDGLSAILYRTNISEEFIQNVLNDLLRAMNNGKKFYDFNNM